MFLEQVLLLNQIVKSMTAVQVNTYANEVIKRYQNKDINSSFSFYVSVKSGKQLACMDLNEIKETNYVAYLVEKSRRKANGKDS